MPHSSAITDMKQEAIRRLLQCDMFIDALDVKDIENKCDLV